ncbi:MAG: glycerol-3-phosphate dehydrogenase subunit GlpB [Desulfobacterales bacterium]|nr:glycerol-3-phosphate dehydrogenase subunit GlpB [Desulfobacterales bacterium]
MSNTETLNSDITIIGSGMAGMTAAFFAAKRGLSTIQIGHPTCFSLYSGFLDLLGVFPTETQKPVDDPWKAMDMLIQTVPKHPYAFIPKQDIRTAFDMMLSFFESEGLSYVCHGDANAQIITPMGTLKPTYAIPIAADNSYSAFQKKAPTLLLDVYGLKDFHAKQIFEVLRSTWPDLRIQHSVFPETEHLREVYPEHLANLMDMPSYREKWISTVKPYIKNIDYLGLPSILGIRNHHSVFSDIQAQLGVHVFEIPTRPISIPGIRMRHCFEHRLSALDVKQFFQQKVTQVSEESNGNFLIKLDQSGKELTIQTRTLILATGRFMSGGLRADYQTIHEPVFHFPICQPNNRNLWHEKAFFASEGHAINKAGIEVNRVFQPISESGKPIKEKVCAIGSILANHDWMRMKSGSGVSIASAYAAVNFLASKL